MPLCPIPVSPSLAKFLGLSQSKSQSIFHARLISFCASYAAAVLIVLNEGTTILQAIPVASIVAFPGSRGHDCVGRYINTSLVCLPLQSLNTWN